MVKHTQTIRRQQKFVPQYHQHFPLLNLEIQSLRNLDSLLRVVFCVWGPVFIGALKFGFQSGKLLYSWKLFKKSRSFKSFRSRNKCHALTFLQYFEILLVKLFSWSIFTKIANGPYSLTIFSK